MQPLILAGIPDPMKQEYLALAANQKFHALFSMCDSRDGAARLVAALPTTLLPAEISRPGDPRRVWELCGLYYFNTLRVQECLAIFHSLYSHMLVYQEQKRRYAHKGMPLVWISDCYERLNSPVLSKRYLMLTTCEDAIAHKGTVNSLAFWLTARRHGLAGNGQYCGKAALSSLPGLPVGLPKSPLPGLSGCASQSLRRGVRVWLTALVGDPAVIGALFFISHSLVARLDTVRAIDFFNGRIVVASSADHPNRVSASPVAEDIACCHGYPTPL